MNCWLRFTPKRWFYTVDAVGGRFGKYWEVVFNAWLNINRIQPMEMTRNTLHLCVATTMVFKLPFEIVKLKKKKKALDGEGEMAQWLRAFILLSKQLGSQHPQNGSQLSITPVPGDPTSTHSAHICMRTKYSYTQNKLFGKHRGILLKVLLRVKHVKYFKTGISCIVLPNLAHSRYWRRQEVLAEELHVFFF